MSKKPDLGALVAHYQETLRLRDWRLDVTYCRDLVDSRGAPVWGLCLPTVDAKSATIWIRDPETPPAGHTVEQAVAQVVETIVHELVHLHLAPFGTSTPAEVAAEEQAVWALAGAIVKSGAKPAGASAHYRLVAGAAAPPRASLVRPSAAPPTPVQLENRARLRTALGLAANAPVSAILSALRSRVSKSDREVLDAIAAEVGAPRGAEPFEVYQAMTGKFGDIAKASDAQRAQLQPVIERVGMLLLDAVGADLAAVYEGFRKRFKLDTAPIVARRAPSPTAHPSEAERRRMTIDVARASFNMPTASDADVEVRLYQTRPELMASRTVRTRFGAVTLTARELAMAASRVAAREEPGRAFERLIQDYAENKAGDERARGARKD